MEIPDTLHDLPINFDGKRKRMHWRRIPIYIENVLRTKPALRDQVYIRTRPEKKHAQIPFGGHLTKVVNEIGAGNLFYVFASAAKTGEDEWPVTVKSSVILIDDASIQRLAICFEYRFRIDRDDKLQASIVGEKFSSVETTER